MARKRIFTVSAVLIAITLVACSHGPGGMGGMNHMMGYGYGGVVMWIIVLVLAGVGIYFLFQMSKKKGSDGSITETPVDTLKKRYAKGEINKEEFDEMKKDLESPGFK